MAQRANITDRAKRYRAQKSVTGPRKCVMCGSRSDLGVMHLTGNESHGEPANLAYGCRSCNGVLSSAFKTLKLGRPTNQYNPASKGVPTFEQYMWAVSNHTRGAHDEGGAVIHATPKSKRIEYARRIVTKAQRTKRERNDERWNPVRSNSGGERAYRSTKTKTRSLKLNAQGILYTTPDESYSKYWGEHTMELEISPSRTLDFTRFGSEESVTADDLGKFLRDHGVSPPKTIWSRGEREMLEYFGQTGKPLVAALRRAGYDSARINEYVYGVGGSTSTLLFSTRLARIVASNPWPFSSRQAPIPATGGIAHHMAKSGKSKPVAQSVDSGRHKGYTLSKTPGGEFYSSLDPQSWFETKAQAKAHIDRYLKGRANPASGSAEVFEEFHGFKASEVVTVTKKQHYHKHLAAAGKLTHLDVWGIDDQGHKITGFKGAILAFNESKNQLFVEGGDQSVDVADFGIDTPHELETLGRLTDIGYQTNKTHLGDEGGEAVYVHKFRSTNVGGKHVIVRIARYPDLIYDVRNEQLLLSGGSYEILAEGINK